MNCDDGQATSDFVDARSGVKSLGNHRESHARGQEIQGARFRQELAGTQIEDLVTYIRDLAEKN
jgi:hypothetical protein